MTNTNDLLHRFQLERAGVRGAIVRLDEAWQRIRANGDYSGPLAELLGQTVAASALFTVPGRTDFKYVVMPMRI